MQKYLILALIGILVGGGLGFITRTYAQPFLRGQNATVVNALLPPQNQVIGFLPYWLIVKADKNYSPYITTLAYFGLTIETDGTIQQYTDEDEIEGEPGFVALNTGRADAILKKAKGDGKTLSLVIFRADNEAITELLSSPAEHANALIEDVTPIMREYGFRDLNIDIEHVGRATVDERERFVTFLATVKAGVKKNKLGTLTVEITGSDLLKQNLSDPKAVGTIADYVVIMAYDYHYAGSEVTGPVAPLGGGGDDAEYDTKIALQKALEIIPAEKIILGIPLYGYQWETIGNIPRSAVIPGTGQTASHRRVEEQLSTCTDCIKGIDQPAREPYVIYQEDGDEVYDQIFFPDGASTQAKIDLANANEIGGIALWAIGYEGSGILEPLRDYIK